MMKKSAGLLLYRIREKDIEIFLIHPGGPFWKNKDEGAWSIPKGEFTDEDGLTAAKREFLEETGFEATGKFIALHPVKQKSGKTVHAWALEMDMDASKIKCNLFDMEWPPKSGKIIRMPEVDKAEWFTVSNAMTKINVMQQGFIVQLLKFI